jgi:hypothetical protein
MVFLMHGHFDLKKSHFDSRNWLPDDNVGEESSDEWSSSNKCVSSVVCSSASIPLKPHSFKPSTKSSFDVIQQPKDGQTMIGPVVKLPLAAYPIQDCLQRMSTPKCIAT